MTIGRVLTGIGTGIVTLLVVTVAVIEILSFEFSAIIGLPIGLLSGLLVAAVVVARFDGLTGPFRWLVAGVSGIGYGLLVALGGSYVNLTDLGTTEMLGLGLLVGLLVGLGTIVFDVWADRP